MGFLLKWKNGILYLISESESKGYTQQFEKFGKIPPRIHPCLPPMQ